MTGRIRKSVPTGDLQRWWNVGWAYVMPDFDIPDHSKIEWLSDQPPADPDHTEQLAREIAALDFELKGGVAG